MTTFAPLEIAPRLGRLRDLMERERLDALVVTRLPNVRYLTGFTGSAGTVLVRHDAALLVTDGRYGEQATEQLAGAGVACVVETAPTIDAQRAVLARALAGAGRVGLEEHGVTWAQQQAFAEAFAPAEIVAAGTPVEECRRSKDAGEVDRIRAACAIADESFAAVSPMLHEQPTESEVALALEIEMRRRGASGVSFDSIVASGPNSSMPHARPTERRIAPGELVVLDFGCVVDGYCSDMTRTVAVGDPGAEARRLHDVVLTAQRAGRDAVAAGIDCAELDAVCRGVISDAGLGEMFVHSTGHGVGLEIHEAPRVAATARDTVVLGDVVTVEPGVYLPGIGGVRIEDTVVVTASGAESLTRTPKELIL